MGKDYKNYTGVISYRNFIADVENATFIIYDNKNAESYESETEVLWYSGKWNNGIWNNGDFHSGTWNNGIFKNGNLYKAALWVAGKYTKSSNNLVKLD